jgi:hypothetical protein
VAQCLSKSDSGWLRLALCEFEAVTAGLRLARTFRFPHFLLVSDRVAELPFSFKALVLSKVEAILATWLSLSRPCPIERESLSWPKQSGGASTCAFASLRVGCLV